MKVEVMNNYPVEELNRTEGMNYMVCAMGMEIGETKRLDEAIKLTEANKDKDNVMDIRIVEYSTRKAYYFM